MKQLTPDPMNDQYAIDNEGRLYQKTIIVHAGEAIDIGYSLSENG